jgi:hypothetical protein
MSEFGAYQDPMIYRLRRGDSTDPLLPVEQSDKVRNNVILLKEIPDKFQGIVISDGINTLSILDSGLPDSNSVVVDWVNGILKFHDINNGKTYSISYFGRGAVYMPSNKIYTDLDENGNVTETLKSLTDTALSAKQDVDIAIADSETQASYAKNQGDYAKGIRDNFGHKGNYSPTISYKNGNVVTFGGINYFCIQDTSVGIDPLNGAYWTVVSPQASINKKTWTATEDQTVFTITNGNYVVNQGNIDVLVGGVPQVSGIGFTETNSTTITLSEGVPVGTIVFAKWFEGTMSISKAHKTSHELGGQDELDITKMKNFQEQVASPLAQNMTDIASVKKYGAKGDGTTDDTASIQAAFNASKAVFFPAGTYKITDTITITPETSISGAGNRLSIIKSYLTGNKHLFQLNASDYTQKGISVRNMKFEGIGAGATDGFAFKITKATTNRFNNCDFFNLGAGAVWIEDSFTNYLTDCFVGFNARNSFYNNYGAIHVPRVNSGNSLSVLNCYISNNTAMHGILFQGQSLRVIGGTIETSQILLNVGDPSIASRGVTIHGVYFENPYVGDVRLAGVYSASIEGMYANDTGPGGGGQYSIFLDHPVENVSFKGCHIGESGIKTSVSDPIKNVFYKNVNFENCSNVKFLDADIRGIRDVATADEFTTAYGGHGYSENLIPYSDDLSLWTNNNSVLSANSVFTDGSTAYTLSKSGAASYDVFVNIGTVNTGEKICFSFFAKNGNAEAKFRGRRTSDNVYEDITKIIATPSNNRWERYYVSFTADKDYNIMNIRISAGGYGSTTGSIEVFRCQAEKGTLKPTPPIKTVGNPHSVSDLRGVVNGSNYTVGKNLSKDGIGVGNSAAATTLGTVTKKMEVFDVNGVSLGYVPIYNSIT